MGRESSALQPKQKYYTIELEDRSEVHAKVVDEETWKWFNSPIKTPMPSAIAERYFAANGAPYPTLNESTDYRIRRAQAVIPVEIPNSNGTLMEVYDIPTSVSEAVNTWKDILGRDAVINGFTGKIVN